MFSMIRESDIEGLSGLWCASLGFSEGRLVEAARKQMEILPFYLSEHQCPCQRFSSPTQDPKPTTHR